MTTTFGFVSTYPPTQCGLATFTHSLRAALRDPGDHAPVARLVERAEARPSPEVVAQIVEGDPASLRDAVTRLDDCDVVVLQHEFGIYGGPDGDEVLDILARTHAATIVVLHTVLTAPTPHQREVLQAVVDAADAVVTMTPTARDRLVASYRVRPEKVSIIPHGAPESRTLAIHPVFRSSERFTVLTWGLLGPGKGIEWAIEAMALVDDVVPAPHYVVAGQTHPKVLAHEGERYRSGLGERVRRLGLESAVTFDAHYRDAASLERLVASADLVLLPYDSRDQVTSGVLIEAVAAGRPVIATAFPHARELLSGGAGIVVPHEDPGAIAEAIRTVATGRGVAAAMAGRAAATAPDLLWGSVADRYRELAGRIVSARIAA